RPGSSQGPVPGRGRARYQGATARRAVVGGPHRGAAQAAPQRLHKALRGARSPAPPRHARGAGAHPEEPHRPLVGQADRQVRARARELMSTSADELRAWFERGELTGKRYMVVATDTFDYEDYPIYTDAPVAEVERLRAQPMTKMMEVYDLRKRFDARR